MVKIVECIEKQESDIYVYISNSFLCSEKYGNMKVILNSLILLRECVKFYRNNLK